MPIFLQALLRAVAKAYRTTNRPRQPLGRSAYSVRLLLEPLENRLVPTGLTVADLNAELSASDLVSQLLGQGVAVSNITFTGNNSAAGTFSGGADIIGFDVGIVLSTGNISNVIGPNNASGSTQANNLAGDTDLDGLTGGNTRDATILEFDFVPDFNTISFQYVFASEEYNEYVDSQYNDVFGFFLNGQNVALLPGTSNPVSIHTVNAQQNSQYFINNDQSSGAPLNTQMDGLTTVLTVVATVNPGQVNHIKLAIADVGDFSFDSAVFLKASSFETATTPELTAPGDQQATEGSLTSIALGSFSDGDGGPWTVTVNWGDDSSDEFIVEEAGALGNLQHTYQSPGSATVTITVADASGLSSAISFNVAIANPDVMASGGFSVTGSEGSETTAQTVATFTDPGGPESAASYTAIINWGDGTTSAGVISEAVAGVFTVSGTHIYADSGSYTITTTIEHGLTTPQTAFSVAQIANIKPTVTPITVQGSRFRLSNEGHVTIGQNVALSGIGSFTDPGADTWTVAVSFGDGTGRQVVEFAADKSFTLPEHAYAATGNYLVTVFVTDDDREFGVATLIVNVLTIKEFNSVGKTAVVELSPGGANTVSTEDGGKKVEAKANLPEGVDASGATVSLANYSQNPTNDGSGASGDPSTHALINVTGDSADTAAPLAFFDVRANQLAEIPGASLEVTFTYTIDENAEDNIVLYFWDGAAWQLVRDGVDRDGDGIGDAPRKGTVLNPDGSIARNADGTITRTITLTYNEAFSNPRLSQLTGTVFTVAAPVPSASPTTVATIGSPFSFVSNTGQSTFASDAGQFGRTAAFTSNSTTTLSLRVSQDAQSSASRSVVAPSGEEVAEEERPSGRTTEIVNELIDWLERLLLPPRQAQAAPPAKDALPAVEQVMPEANEGPMKAPQEMVPADQPQAQSDAIDAIFADIAERPEITWQADSKTANPTRHWEIAVPAVALAFHAEAKQKRQRRR